jgi:hypothetical protein
MRVAGPIQKRHFYRHVPRLKNPREVSRELCRRQHGFFWGHSTALPTSAALPKRPVSLQKNGVERDLVRSNASIFDLRNCSRWPQMENTETHNKRSLEFPMTGR